MPTELFCAVEPVDLTDTFEDALLTDLSDLCCFALGQEGAIGGWDVALVLTTDEHLAQLHAEFMGIPEPTDIMTFPSDDESGGDIVISAAQAERQRSDDGWDLATELGFLVVHGVLHLTGWDDATQDAREQMLARQRDIIDAFQLGGPSRIR